MVVVWDLCWQRRTAEEAGRLHAGIGGGPGVDITTAWLELLGMLLSLPAGSALQLSVLQCSVRCTQRLRTYVHALEVARNPSPMEGPMVDWVGSEVSCFMHLLVMTALVLTASRLPDHRCTLSCPCLAAPCLWPPLYMLLAACAGCAACKPPLIAHVWSGGLLHVLHCEATQ